MKIDVYGDDCYFLGKSKKFFFAFKEISPQPLYLSLDDSNNKEIPFLKIKLVSEPKNDFTEQKYYFELELFYENSIKLFQNNPKNQFIALKSCNRIINDYSLVVTISESFFGNTIVEKVKWIKSLNCIKLKLNYNEKNTISICNNYFPRKNLISLTTQQLTSIVFGFLLLFIIVGSIMFLVIIR